MNQFNIRHIYFFLFLFTTSFSLTFAQSDEITSTINDAVEQYKDGNYSDAIENLDYAAQLIRQIRSENLEDLFPEPLSGWEADEATSTALGASMFGGGISAEQSYYKGSKRIEISIVTDSPMLQTMLMMFSNPMIASSSGGKLERINGQKAIVKFSTANEEGEITMVIDNRFLVTVRGDHIIKNDLKDYASAIDFKKLEDLP
jgi:hypothetical protein